jgi:uncharacterized protein YebE (UPF0316 family)
MVDILAAPVGALIIFGLRVVDVSMGTVRMILGVRGYRGQAATIGFFEVLIWLIAVGAALQHLTSILHIVGYAGGFAVGNYAGIWLESRFALGTRLSGRRFARTVRERRRAHTRPPRRSAQQASPSPS